MKKVHTSISIDEDVNIAIMKIAAQQDRNFSQQLNFILKEFLKKEKGK